MKTEWLSVRQYAVLKGISKQRVYKQIETGIIPKEKVRVAVIKVKRKQIKTEVVDK